MVGKERLCAKEPCLHLKRFPSQAGLISMTARSAGQLFLTYRVTRAPRGHSRDEQALNS